jgi:hypothetical protein
MLLQTGDFKSAELVFWTDLEKNPRNPRSLFGLAQALRAQGRGYDAAWVKKQFETAWAGADMEVRLDKL